MALHPRIADVTARITERSRDSRSDYLSRMQTARDAGPGRRNQDRSLVFTAKTPFGFEEGTTLSFSMAHMAGNVRITGRFRLSATTAAVPPFDPVPARVRPLLAIPESRRTENQRREILRHFVTIDPASAEAARAIEAEKKAQGGKP